MLELSPQTFQELTERIHKSCGLVLGEDKTYLIRHRLEPVIRRYNLDGFEHLVSRLRMRSEVPLHDAIIEAITTQETSFFRDTALFQAIRERVLPECASLLQKSGAKRHRIRFWSAGSSTGQEAYSLAMLIRDFVEADRSKEIRESHFNVLASDISAGALEVGQTGRYSRSEVARGLSESVLQRHFQRDGDGWTAGEPLRSLVHFRRFNLLHSPTSLGAFDLILCRNVLIYFDEPTRKHVCQALYRILHDGGYLVLGAAESLYGIEDRMEDVKVGRMVLYRKPHKAG